MARSDLILSLVRAGTKGDQALFRRSVEAIIAEERAKQHHVLAEELTRQLSSQPVQPISTSNNGSALTDLVIEVDPSRALSDLILPSSARRSCEELIEEQHRADLLRSHGLEPRNRVLLIGPPGNGKTSLAEGLAHSLMVPLLSVRYEGIIGSYLGETATRLRRLFDYVRTRRCVLFFDEFDTLGKERGDPHDSGEIKRVVSSLLLQIDRLPTHVVIVTATNHHELLDRAVWRRFQIRTLLPPPSKSEVVEWVGRFDERTRSMLGPKLLLTCERLHFASFAELEEFCTGTIRRLVLSGPDLDPIAVLQSRAAEWSSRVGPSCQKGDNRGGATADHPARTKKRRPK